MKTDKKVRVPVWETTVPGRLLVWKGKHSDEYWLADTPKRYKAAFLAMFETLDANEMYFDLADDEDSGYCKEELAKLKKKVSLLESNPELLEEKDTNRILQLERTLKETALCRNLWQQAKEGDWKAAWDLIGSRRDWEYEGWDILIATDPLLK